MANPYQIYDIGRFLSDRDLVPDPHASVANVSSSPFSLTRLIRIAVDATYAFEQALHEERCLLVLEGAATVTVDQARQTLGPGHLMTIEPGAKVSVSNEGTKIWSALWIESPPSKEALADENP
jgi:mannose-6-phosphate isomerase-like protein (cupin superfamily)